jgi:Ca2+-binding RTX toxin-like protein
LLIQESQFWVTSFATSAHAASDRLIYNTGTGGLYYDADGTGGVDSVQIATIKAAYQPAVQYTDFHII